MARYIDAELLLEKLKKQYGEELGWQCTVNMSDVGMMIEDAPTADVAPKSEVERLNKELDELAEEHSDLIVEKDQLFDIAEKQKKDIEQLTINMNAFGLGMKREKERADNAIREFAKFLIGKARNGCIKLCDLPDLVIEFSEVDNGTVH